MSEESSAPLPENHSSDEIYAAPLRSGIVRLTKRLFSDTWPIACSEGVTKLSNLALVVVVARRFGSSGMGVLALCESLLLYAIAISDMGAKLIGIRLAAQHEAALPTLISQIQRKRRALSIVALLVTSLAAMSMLHERSDAWTVLLFLAAVIPYASSIDWAPWGRGQFAWLAAWRSAVSVSYVVTALGLIFLVSGGLRQVAAARVVSYAAALTVLAAWRRRYVGPAPPAVVSRAAPYYADVLWKSILVLGLASLANQIFQTSDVILLGAFRSTRDVGLYAAAYKILFVLFSVFYLITQTYIPLFSRLTNASSRGVVRDAVVRGVGLAVGLGVTAGVVVWAGRGTIITALYGGPFTSATSILAVLAIAIPLDFVSAVLGVFIVAGGRYKASLATLGTAAVLNVAMNSIAIPRYGPHGAAVTTAVSYAVLVVLQGIVVRTMLRAD